MRFQRYFILFAVMVILLVCASACTTIPNPGSGPSATVTTAAPVTPAMTAAASVLQTTKSSGLETTINTRYNDFSCIALHSVLGVDYLYADQMYTIWVTSPGTVNVCLLYTSDAADE